MLDSGKFDQKRKRLIGYLMMKVEEGDWHGVSDAANDLRVLECEWQTINKYPVQEYYGKSPADDIMEKLKKTNAKAVTMDDPPSTITATCANCPERIRLASKLVRFPG